MKIGKFDVGEYVVREMGGKKHLVFDCKNCVYGSSLSDDSACRFHAIAILQEVEAKLLVLADVYERVYDEQQTELVKEIALMAKRFENESIWSYAHLGTQDSECEQTFASRHTIVVRIAHDLARFDPVMAYLTCLQEIKKETGRATGLNEGGRACSKVFLDTLLYLKNRFEQTGLIGKTKEYLLKLRSIPDTKDVYKSLLEAQIKPAFIGSRLLFGETEELELLDEYSVGRAAVQIFSHPNKIEKLYFLNPPEYTLPPEKYFVLSKTKEIVASYKPGSTTLSGIAKSRKYFERIYESTIHDIGQANQIFLSPEEAKELAEIVARYTVGYGILELILGDRHLTDIFLDSPIGMKPIYVVHEDYGQCQTNILYTDDEANALVSKMRAMSGRPFDEVHPVLDFDLPDLETRVAVIGKPLAPDGTAFAFRLHKVTPWTLPQFIDNNFINPLGAGLLSFFVDQQATMLITGSRGSGKCVDGGSLLQLGNGQTEKIKKIIDPIIKKAQRTIELADGVCIDLQENGIQLETVTMTPGLKTQIVPVSKVWRRAAPKKMVSVTLRSGKRVVTTPEHPFFLTEKGKIIQKRADELTICDFIATPRIIPAKQDNNYSTDWIPTSRSLEPKLCGIEREIQEFLCSYSKNNSLKELATKARLPYKTILNIKSGVRKTISLSELRSISGIPGLDYYPLVEKASYWIFRNSPNRINAGFFFKTINNNTKAARFLGLLLGDGHIDEKSISFTNTNIGLLEEFRTLCRELFGIKAYICFPKNRSPHCMVTSVGLSRLISLRFGIPFGKKAGIQEMPKEIVMGSEAVLSEFLRAYFDCDGSVHIQKRLVDLSTASKKMAFDIQNALHRFGIISFLRAKTVRRKEYYIVAMSGENAFVFSQKIGFSLSSKKEKLAQAFLEEKFNTNIDIVPNCLPFLQTIQKCHGVFTARMVTLDQKNISRKKLQRFISSSDSGLVEIEDLKKLACSDIFWDEITEVQRIDYEKEFVYDLTIEGTQNFVVNGIIAHNTSLVQALMLEIVQGTRIILQEDSVTGDSRILVERNNKMEYTTVGELIDGLIGKYGCINVNDVDLLDANPEDISVFSLNKQSKIKLSRVSQFSRHQVKKDILKVSTASGKDLKVTKDHSLFGLNTEGRIVPVKTSDLKVGQRIATPLCLPFSSNEVEKLSVLPLLNNRPKAILSSINLCSWIQQNWKTVKELARKKRYSKSMPSAWKRCSILPATIFFEVQQKNPRYFPDLRFKLQGLSKSIPVEWELDADLVAFCGLWLADGCYDNRFAAIISAGHPSLKNLVQSVANKAGLTMCQHSDGFSPMISNINLVFLMKNLLELTGNSYTKKIPNWVFSLSDEMRGVFLKGLFSGDGYATKKEIGISLCSKEMIRQIQTLLLSFGISVRARKFVKKDKTFVCKISHVKNVRLFKQFIGFFEEYKCKRLEKLCAHVPTQDNSDTIPLSIETKEKVVEQLKGFSRCDYIARGSQIGRTKLNALLKQNQSCTSLLLKELQQLVSSDVFWDEVIKIEKVDGGIHTVYDFSVPECENFVCENIIAHNTLEIPAEYMKNIGFNIQRLKTRSPISVSKTESEVAPEEALRTALRLGDSALIIGEVRSVEARVLYEAMRIGAAGNIVLGSIHGDSAYSVWDRVVNDLGVPNTSFKATDVVVVARPIRFEGSLKRQRRVVQVTEVKKHWTQDPDQENALLDLMLYTAKNDKLGFQEDSLKDSELFQKLSATSGLNMREMWTAIKANASSKAFLVDLKNKHDLPALLEAENYAKCTNKYLLLREEQIEAGKKVDYDVLLGKWKFWVQNSVAKRLLEQKHKKK
ncbi:Flp pilus assembly complex ATPase component TadA [Candidatus Micrarchaeota archaeon]|nr:Flp pilus assembly complex ATPase component TadA [Candidatus Micrarchaeota archaeon]